MTVVKALAESGVTVCATIHSPTSYSFNLFDRLTMLVGGSLVYFGRKGGLATLLLVVFIIELTLRKNLRKDMLKGMSLLILLSSDDAIRFFTEVCPNVKEFTSGYNDAEYITDLITEADRMGRGGEFAQAYAG